MDNLTGERALEPEPVNGAVMCELFESIGFEIDDEDSYNLLAEHTETSGERSRIHRIDATLHGRCWKLGYGLEVWSILRERHSEIYYADCRPSFRSRYVRVIQPWELIEYDEDGEAIVQGSVQGGAEVVFELQNLTELNPHIFRETKLRVGLAGLAYTAQVQPPQDRIYRFDLAEQLPEFAGEACENDYIIAGRVLAWREIKNPITSTVLVWIYVDAAKIRLEILTSARALRGQLKNGTWIAANVWLQGHVLEEAEITARYEGVDHDYETSDFWAPLRRDN
jgi:hypothetical protein